MMDVATLTSITYFIGQLKLFNFFCFFYTLKSINVNQTIKLTKLGLDGHIYVYHLKSRFNFTG